jgi:hypothetical protein
MPQPNADTVIIKPEPLEPNGLLLSYLPSALGATVIPRQHDVQVRQLIPLGTFIAFQLDTACMAAQFSPFSRTAHLLRSWSSETRKFVGLVVSSQPGKDENTREPVEYLSVMFVGKIPIGSQEPQYWLPIRPTSITVEPGTGKDALWTECRFPWWDKAVYTTAFVRLRVTALDTSGARFVLPEAEYTRLELMTSIDTMMNCAPGTTRLRWLHWGLNLPDNCNALPTKVWLDPRFMTPEQRNDYPKDFIAEVANFSR